MREKPSREWMKGRTGSSSNAWKGERAGYHATHLWLTANYTKGESCEDCGKVTPWLDWANISGLYQRERSDYKVLCRKCHRLMDIGNKCRKGHEYKPDTTYVNNRGHRWCLICKENKYATVN